MLVFAGLQQSVAETISAQSYCFFAKYAIAVATKHLSAPLADIILRYLFNLSYSLLGMSIFLNSVLYFFAKKYQILRFFFWEAY